MTAEILPPGMAMTGNPILVKVTASGEKYVQVCVKHDNKEIFSTSGIPDTNGRVCRFVSCTPGNDHGL